MVVAKNRKNGRQKIRNADCPKIQNGDQGAIVIPKKIRYLNNQNTTYRDPKV